MIAKARNLLLILGILSATALCQRSYFVKFSEAIPHEALAEACRSGKILSEQKRNSTGGSFPVLIRNLAERAKVTDSRIQHIYKFVLPAAMTEDEFRASISALYPIEYLEAEHVYRVDAAPNDSLYTEQWGLQKIDIETAWKVTQGVDTVLIGVVDTGIDYTHADLKNKIYFNPGEMGLDSLGRDKRFNGVDDDGDGFVDDYMGWDFVNRVGFAYDSTGGDYLDWDNNPMDEDKQFSHGTSIAGVIGAETNNRVGIAGVAPKIKLLNCRAMDPDGNGSEEDVASAILYATMMGARVINMSFGDNSFSYVLRDVIRYAYEKNVVLVASSGNDGSNLPHYPSGYSEVISVGNSTPEDYVASNSNFGSRLDLIAPGTSIMTTAKNNQYHTLDGTSLSAPFVSGTAGLILSVKNYTNEEVKQILKSTADDIGTVGWDEHSGAGRLNAGKALNILAPALIKFTYPYQDFATTADTVSVSATVLSPYFTDFSFSYGYGYSPVNWIPVIEGRQYQIANARLATIVVSGLKGDSIITIRLHVNQSNGSPLEERINIHVIKDKVKPLLVTLSPALYGDKPTILASTYSEQQGIVRMYYRESGSSAFNFVTLDGLSMNTSFVRNAHYGYIPLNIAKPNTPYEIYFEFENLVGVVTTLYDSTTHYYQVLSPTAVNAFPVIVDPFTLGKGAVFGYPLNITGAPYRDVIFYKNGNTQTAYIYSLSDSTFVLKDSLSQRIVKAYGDFTGSGKNAFLANWNRNLYFLEQQSANSTTFTDKFKKEDQVSWPVAIGDFDGDGRAELLEIKNDTTLALYRVKPDYSLDSLSSINNFGRGPFGRGVFNSPNAVFAGLNKSGKSRIWITDDLGNILCMQVSSTGKLIPDTLCSFAVDLTTTSADMAVGDFDGDGKPDLALLLHSQSQLQIAQFYDVIVVSFASGTPEIIYDKTFIDPSAEYSSLTRQPSSTVKFADVDANGHQELIVGTYPYAYILRYTANQLDDIIYYAENVSANTILAGDFKGDGIQDIALPTTTGIHFIRLSRTTGTVQPNDVTGYSLDSTSVYLSWHGNSSRYYIYRSTDSTVFNLVDSTQSSTFVDNPVSPGIIYYYKIGAQQTAGGTLFSTAARVFAHKPARIRAAQLADGSRSLRLEFTGNIETAISNLTNFHLISSTGDLIYPASVAVVSQTAYQVTFGSHVHSGIYKFLVAGLHDAFGSPIPSDTIALSFSDAPKSQEFYISSFSIESAYILSITFNLPVDSVSVRNVQNYVFKPANLVKSVFVDGANPAKIYLQLDGSRPIGATGIEHVLQILNVCSSSGSGKIPIQTGAGSVIQLSAFASDLSGIYTYPNPVHPSRTNMLTFAGLPKFAEVQVFSLDGKHLKTLQTSDGTGGVAWNMICEDGKQLSSGIYLYLLRQLNENGDEIRTKLAKFTVVR